jgi:hypothetical protein
MLQNALRCWKFLNYKDPANWTSEDVSSFFETLTPSAQSGMLDAVRQVAPQFREKGGLHELKTGRFRERIPRRKKDIFGAEVKQIIEALKAKNMGFELLIFLLHVTLGAREGSHGVDAKSGLTGITWDRFKKNFSQVDLFESKVRGGIWSRDCPTDLLFPHLPEQLRAVWTSRGKPISEPVISGGYTELTDIYRRIKTALSEYWSEKLDPALFKEFATLRPHDADKIHCNLLWEAEVPLEVVAGQYLGQSEGIGLMGRIWLDINTIKKHYLSLTARSERFQKIRAEVTGYSQRFNGHMEAIA